MTDTQYMQKAIRLSLKGKGKVSPNPLVGAVIVRKKQIIAQGWHKKCGADHAEIMAIKQAPGSLKAATLYVTLEPCNHTGRTPPCVDAIIAKGFKRVVIGCKDPNPLTKGKSIRKLKAKGIQVEVGVLKDQVVKTNEVFFTYMTQHRPFIAAKTAQTLDGKIATSIGQSKWITQEATRSYARKIRDDFDAIMVGINTITKDDPGLNAHKKSKKIKKIVLDSTLAISQKARIFQAVDAARCIMVTTKRASLAKRSVLQNLGAQVLVAPILKNGRIDLAWVMRELAKEEITSILIEGGANVIGSALKQKLVDKMYFYIAPKIIGDRQALDSIVGLDIFHLQKAIKLDQVKITKINQDIMMEGYVFRNR
jgi:diaminohydroxyphosphoribosylaminopyrimidine deaminase/5-amino-6-(5-phosphoribosylamino)uracil reductase